jgi:hypothetical protein
MFTSREITPEGFGKKTRIWDDLKTGPQQVTALRQAYADITNAWLEKYGLPYRIDPRTLEAQGIDRIPQIHEGPNGRAMYEGHKTPQSQTRYDVNGREIDWKKIDGGKTRAEFNGDIRNTNEKRQQFGPEPLHVQIKNIDRDIEALISRLVDVKALIPVSLLPTWFRARYEWIKYKMLAIAEAVFLERQEAEERRIRRQREDEGIHSKMKRMKEEIERLERDKERRQALQRLFTRIEHIVTTRPPAAQVNQIHTYDAPPPRVLSIEQYNYELTIKADIARAAVPPEYRPRIEVKNVVSDQPDKPQEAGLMAQFDIAKPADNGGLAEPPPPITTPFNEMANPAPEQPYKQKVQIGFGIK